MIDTTSNSIEHQISSLRRANRRRYAFQRMLEATDKALWRPEEMNRDGVKTVPKSVRTQLRQDVATMPNHALQPLRATGQAQNTLQNPFEFQQHHRNWTDQDRER